MEERKGQCERRGATKRPLLAGGELGNWGQGVQEGVGGKDDGVSGFS